MRANSNVMREKMLFKYRIIVQKNVLFTFKQYQKTNPLK